MLVLCFTAEPCYCSQVSYSEAVSVWVTENCEHCTVYQKVFVILSDSRWLMCMNFSMIVIMCTYEGLSSHAALPMMCCEPSG